MRAHKDDTDIGRYLWHAFIAAENRCQPGDEARKPRSGLSGLSCHNPLILLQHLKERVSISNYSGQSPFSVFDPQPLIGGGP